MYQLYNLYDIEPLFKIYLKEQNKSDVTIKNYSSDLRLYMGWLFKKFSLQLLPKNLTEVFFYTYVDYLLSSNIPRRTINRRLSSLRSFISFCYAHDFISSDISNTIKNIPQVTTYSSDYIYMAFKQNLDPSHKTSKETLNNIKEFILADHE